MSSTDFFIPVAKLLNGFEKIGIVLQPATEKTDIYIWQTGAHAIYIGKKSADRNRGVQERGWVDETPVLTSYEVPFTRIMRRTKADLVEYVIEKTDLELIRAKLEEYEVTGFNTGFAELENKTELTNAEVETALIRATVQAGYILSNSAGAGLWDGDLRLGHLLGSLAAWEAWQTDDDFISCLLPEEIEEAEKAMPTA